MTYANVVASIALFLALGGVSYAAATLPKNSVGNKQIKKNAVSIDKLDKKLQAALATVGAAGAKGESGANGTNGTNGVDGARGPSDAYSGTTASPINFSPTAGPNTATTVATVSLPPGKYEVFGWAAAHNPAGGASIALSCLITGGNASAFEPIAVDSDGSVSMNTPLDLSAASGNTAVSLKCGAVGTALASSVAIYGGINAVVVGDLH
jgi:hypothetical protein